MVVEKHKKRFMLHRMTKSIPFKVCFALLVYVTRESESRHEKMRRSQEFIGVPQFFCI